MQNHLARVVTISEGRAISLGKAANRKVTWAAFGESLASPLRTNEAQAVFNRLPKAEQDALKAVPGWVLGGPVAAGRRQKRQIETRSLLTLDCDEMRPQLLDDLQSGVSDLCEYEFFAHSTRKHRSDKPRLRIYLLPSADFPADRYDAAARILAEQIDPTLDSVDDVSFRPAQMMFRPSASKDQPYVFFRNPGKPVDVDSLLENFRADWTDYKNLPYSEARGQRRKTQDKAEDPTTKRGLVGAFCRAYSVEEAMDAFLPGVYLPGDDTGSKPRYTYAAGTTSNGVVVEDDGLFIYSHHGSDPCGERLCNAFDMVRLHRFADKDDGSESSNPKDLPSYKAMAELVAEDGKVRAQFLADRVDLDEMFEDVSGEDSERTIAELRAPGEYDLDSEIADSLAPSDHRALPPFGAPDRAKKPKKGWAQTDLELAADGRIKPTIPNLATILTNDPRTWGAIGRNTFTNKVTLRRSIRSKIAVVPPITVTDQDNGEEFTDVHDVSLKAILESQAGQGLPGWGLSVARTDVSDAVLLVAERNRFHPVQEYLTGLIWDGEPRLAGFSARVFGTPNTQYYQDAVTLTLVASVARAFNPGHKWDHSPILSGKTGIRKSTCLKALYGDAWCGELTASMASNKDAVEQMFGKLCLELPELSTMRRGEVEDVKAFLTFTEDRVRLAYDRRMSRFKRQCVFWGTTNATDYLKDPTGNRRFWPISVTANLIDTGWISANRDQLWAEAFQIWRKMSISAGHYTRIELVMRGAAAEEALRLQNLHREEDATENTAAMVQAWADLTMPESHFDADPRDVLREVENFAGEPIVRRVAMCARQVGVEALGMSADRLTSNRTLDSCLGHALSALSGWHRLGSRRRMGTYGQVRLYVRDGASPADIERGYEVVGHTGDGPPRE